jgi:AAA family ATP:ADP antiporter
MTRTSDDPNRRRGLRQALDQLGVEAPALWWSLLYFFCLLTGYYVLRPVREAMAASSDIEAVFPRAMIAFFADRGVSLGEFALQVIFTSVFLIMLVLQPVYGWLVSRFPRRVFLPVIYGFFILTLLLFYAMFDSGMPGRGLAFILWITVFNLFAVAVFWSFMADVFDNVQARACYGYIGAAGTVGAFLGPLLTKALVIRLGVANMMLVSAVMLGLCVVCLLRLRHYAVRRERARSLASGERPMGGEIMAGLKLIAREPLLRWLALMVVMGVGVGTLLYNEQNAIVRAMTAGDPAAAEQATAFFSSIDKWINWTVLLLQVFVTRLVLTRWGVAPLLLFPALAIFLGYGVLTAAPLPALVAVVQIVTRASEFALNKPARETIYTRVDRAARYKAKAAIDTVVYRGGDLAFVWIHKGLAAFGSVVVFASGMAVSALFFISAWRVVKEQAKLEERP